MGENACEEYVIWTGNGAGISVCREYGSVEVVIGIHENQDPTPTMNTTLDADAQAELCKAIGYAQQPWRDWAEELATVLREIEETGWCRNVAHKIRGRIEDALSQEPSE